MGDDSLKAAFEAHEWPIVGFTTAEHNNLTTLRAAAITEATARVTSYLTALSAVVVALGFVANKSGFDDTFFAFGAVSLGLVSAVGLLTWGRSLQISLEDLRLVARIERIRAVYVTLVPELADHLRDPNARNPEQARFATGMSASEWTQPFLTMPQLIGVVNSAVAATALAFVIRLTTGSAAVAWVLAATTSVLFAGLHVVVQMRFVRSAFRSN